jgi:hypothetical protein
MSSRREDRELREIIDLDRKILERLPNPHRITPTGIIFKEVTMNPTQAGQVQVFTGTLQPAAIGTTPAAAYPAGVTFTATANDDALNSGAIVVDPTGTIVTVTYPDGWVENAALPLAITYESSPFTPFPSTSPSQVSAVITPSAPPQAAVPTPTSISFVQTQ